jgi:hypothetical protein
MEANIRAALSCFDPNSGLMGPSKVSVSYITGKVRSYEPRFVTSEVWVELEFATGTQDALPSLSITSARYGDAGRSAK